MKTRTLIAVLAVVVAALSVSSANAAVKKCFGKPATIVSGKATINGTRKDDVIVSTARGAENYVYGKGGNDLICGAGQLDWLIGGPGRDKLRGFGSLDFLLGGTGNDILVGDLNDGGGLDSAYYRAAAGPVNVDLGAGRATGDGTDRLVNIDTTWGSEFDDTLVGSDVTDYIWGLGGNDNIRGGANYDFITPGEGDDLADGEEGTFDLIYFDETDAQSGVVVDLAEGTASGRGNDQFTNFEAIGGSPFADELRGNSDANAFLPGGGDDTIDGRGGNDTAVYWLVTSGVTANLQTGQGSSATDGSDSYTSIESLAGTDHNDTFTGDEQNNYIDGNGGDDVLNGGGGDDFFFYNDGHGNDTVDGGAGAYDHWDYPGFQPVDVNLVTGIISAVSFDVTVTGVEAVGTGDAADVIVGNDAGNYLFGYGGDDVIFGGGGDDEIEGGAGIDQVDGGPGTDRCTQSDTPTACEVDTGDVTKHPLQQLADDVEAFRRSLG